VPGLGTLINTVTVVLGSVIGLRFGTMIPERLRTTVVQVIGLVTIAIGLGDVFKTQNIVFPLVGMVLGAILGEWLRIEERLIGVGDWFRRRFASGADANRFSTGFINATMLFCIGPLTILGAIEDGMGAVPRLYIIKASLDGVMSIVFASIYGVGVLFSAVSVFVVQGSLTLTGNQLGPFINERVQTELFAVGGLAVLAIGLNLLGVTKIRLGSLLPGLVVTPLIVMIFAEPFRIW